MWLSPSVNQLVTNPKILKVVIFSHSHNHLLPSSRRQSRHHVGAEAPRRHCRIAQPKKKSAVFLRSQNETRVLCSNSTEGPTGKTHSEKVVENWKWVTFHAWNVPWDWKIALYVMTPYLMSILLTGIVETARLEGILRPSSDSIQAPVRTIDETAIRLFIDQLLKSIIKLALLYAFVSPYQPFPNDIFSYRWTQPLNLRSGWLLWGVGGLLFAASAVFFVEVLMSDPSTSGMLDKADSLAHLLPLVGASSISTASVFGVIGILAPLCEETIYRGFLMTTLTKWLPVQVSVVVSATVFSLAHQFPGKSIEIFIFGIGLGLVYAQTRNLLAPITMHACWNLGVILTLLYCQSHGYDIQKFLNGR